MHCAHGSCGSIVCNGQWASVSHTWHCMAWSFKHASGLLEFFQLVSASLCVHVHAYVAWKHACFCSSVELGFGSRLDRLASQFNGVELTDSSKHTVLSTLSIRSDRVSQPANRHVMDQSEKVVGNSIIYHQCKCTFVWHRRCAACN